MKYSQCHSLEQNNFYSLTLNLVINSGPAESGYALPLQKVLIQISWLLKKPNDLDQLCLSIGM